MNGSITLTERERKRLLKAYRSGENVRMARRAHVLLLLADGLTWEEIRRVLYGSNDLIADVRRRFLEGGVDAVLGAGSCSGESPSLPVWLLSIRRWIERHTPQDFGYFRTRWSCDILAEVLAWQTGIRKSAETIRRGLHRLGFVWRRPRPVVGPTDPEYESKLRRIQRLLKTLPVDEVAVFQDEVDVHLNPREPQVARSHTARLDVDAQGAAGRDHDAGEQPQVSRLRIAGVEHGDAAGQSAGVPPQCRSVLGASG